MGKKGISHRKFSIEFKLSVLSDYFQSNQSEGSICKKYQLSKGTILRWEKEYVLAEKALPLSSELLRKLEQMRTFKETSKVSRSREEELEDEIMRLRKALEYSELRNEALHEVLKIGREQFGIDLLKKLAPSSKQPSAKASGKITQMPLRTVWQNKGRLLFCK